MGLDINKYRDYLEKYKSLVKEGKMGINQQCFINNKYNIPNHRWFIKYCPNQNVKSWSHFLEWCGFVPYQGVSKEMAIKSICELRNKLNRPLIYDDFRGTELNTICPATINKYWGSLNKMKAELGLEIVQESMIDKQLSIEEAVNQIQILCDKAKLEGRDFITTREFNNKNGTANYETLSKMINKYFNMSFSDYIKTLGFRTGKRGTGTSFKFEDGEITTSQFEFLFSKFLKDYGLKYNVDYYRDVKYDNFISDYKGNMNCDYLINYNNKTIYVEIAGIIEAYKNWYYEDREITRSKSKEKYRLKIKLKEQMLKDNNLIYFILFPCDLTRDNFIAILENSSLELKPNIERFMKNNIDWVKIQEIGELKYKCNKLSSHGQKIVDYNMGSEE